MFKQTYEGDDTAPRTFQHIDNGCMSMDMDTESFDLLNHLRRAIGLSPMKPEEADQSNVLIGNRLYQKLKEWFPSGKYIADDILKQISNCQAVSLHVKLDIIRCLLGNNNGWVSQRLFRLYIDTEKMEFLFVVGD